MKCPHCGKPPRPIKEDGKIIWKNLFKMSMESIILVILIIVFVVSYQVDTAECRKLIEHPCDYVEQFDCKINQERVIVNEPTTTFEIAQE